MKHEPEATDYAFAKEAWPTLTVSPETYATYARKHGTEKPAHPADFYLAVACSEAILGAAALLEAHYVPGVERALARLGLQPDAIQEVMQQVRTKLLVGGDEAPKIATYSGRGPLLAWLRAVAVHQARSLVRRTTRELVGESVSALQIAPALADPELDRLRTAYASSFRSAFQEAIASLPTRDRNVLRLVHVEGMTADQVGLVYGVHRVSVARWLGAIRQVLLERTRTSMMERLDISPSDFSSITRLCLSELEVSLERLLSELA